MMNLFLSIALLIAGPLARAQNVHGVLRVVKGDVQIKSVKTGQTAMARVGEQVFPGDIILTGKDSRAKIVMVDNNELNVLPESQFEIQHYEFDPDKDKKDVLLNVIYGKVRSKVEQKYDGRSSKFQVKTPSAIAGVRGTDFMTSFDKTSNTTQVVAFQGTVEFGKTGSGGLITGAVSVTPGKMATSVAGAAPGAPVSVPKDQFAKMDNESKADGAGKSERAPSNEGGDNGKKGGSGPNADGQDRGPASIGTGMLLGEDLASGGGAENAALPTPIQPPPLQYKPPLPPCPNCQQIIQNRSTNLRVILTNPNAP
jgi:hypothetical protein